MKLIITRHGETEENIVGIITGHLPGKLSKLGIEQAKKVALRLKDEKIDAIYSSDLKRSADTAKAIAKYHPKIPISFVTDLREKYLGSWQGKKKSDLGFTSNTSLVKFFPEDGEKNSQLFDRADAFLHQLLNKHLHDTILLVGHNGINQALFAVIMHKTPEDIPNMGNLDNTSISIFEIDENKNHQIHLLNCKKHLD